MSPCVMTHDLCRQRRLEAKTMDSKFDESILHSKYLFVTNWIVIFRSFQLTDINVITRSRSAESVCNRVLPMANSDASQTTLKGAQDLATPKWELGGDFLLLPEMRQHGCHPSANLSPF